MKKFLLALALCLGLATPVSAQSYVNLTYGFGKVFDIPAAEFAIYHVPGVELVIPKGFTFSGKFLIDDYTLDRDMTSLKVRYEKQVKPKLRFGAELENIAYHVDYLNNAREQIHQEWRFFMEGRLLVKTIR